MSSEGTQQECQEKPTCNGTSSDLNISSGNIKSCRQIVELLQKTGIMCSVVSQESVICQEGNCWIENGCQVRLCGLAPEEIEKKVWSPLKSNFNLTCAFLHIHGQYKGCILDYLRPSNCPGPNQASSGAGNAAYPFG